MSIMRKTIDDICEAKDVSERISIMTSRVKHPLFETFADFKVSVSPSDIVNIPETLSYKVERAVFETERGPMEIADAGILTLDIDENDFVKRLLEDDTSVAEVNNIVIKQPPTDITFSGPGAATGAYTVLVTYTTNDGQTRKREFDFSDLNFSHSKNFLNALDTLT